MDQPDFVSLVRRVFAPTDADTYLGVMVDLPDDRCPDHEAWADRRALAYEWARRLFEVRKELGLQKVDVVLYRNVHNNNADFPDGCWVLDAAGLGSDEDPEEPPASCEELDADAQLPLTQVLTAHHILLAPTEFSPTAPLKLAARKYDFRAASMPGFSRAMIPALDLDWVEVDRRCRRLKELVDEAEAARFNFRVGRGEHELLLDLRHRRGQASGGLIRDRGVAGNLPSGETYIVPYEGEIDGDPSRSSGFLPVQLDPTRGEVVLYRIEANRAVGVEGDGPMSTREAGKLVSEPAYGNMAELGLGVLSAWGIEPLGQILLDEKLGLHIAFGRSDHFGGQVGASDFSSHDAVVHIDRVYLPATQPAVTVLSVDLEMPSGDDGSKVVPLMRDGDYVIDWS